MAKSKALEKLLAEVSPAHDLAPWQADALIRRAYSLGRRERGKRVAVGWIYPLDDKPLSFMVHSTQEDEREIKVEVIRCNR